MNAGNLWFLLPLPAFMFGSLLGTLFLGIIPMISMEVFVTDFHYSAFARSWVSWAGAVGAFIGAGVGLLVGIGKSIDDGEESPERGQRVE